MNKKQWKNDNLIDNEEKNLPNNGFIEQKNY
jgi:hypothetical protein